MSGFVWGNVALAAAHPPAVRRIPHVFAAPPRHPHPILEPERVHLVEAVCAPFGDHRLCVLHVRVSRDGQPELACVEVPAGIEVFFGARAQQYPWPGLVGRIEHVRAALEE